MYDAQSKLVGKDTVQVQVANKINMAASQGIKLAYPWSLSTNLHYQRRTTLTAISADASTGDAPQTLQESLLRYRRTVENATGGTFLIRDEALPVEKPARPKPFVSYVSTRGLSQPSECLPGPRPVPRGECAGPRSVRGRRTERRRAAWLLHSRPAAPPRLRRRALGNARPDDPGLGLAVSDDRDGDQHAGRF